MDRNTTIAFVLIGIILVLWMSPFYQKNIVGRPDPAPSDSLAHTTMPDSTRSVFSDSKIRTTTPKSVKPADTRPVRPVEPEIHDTVVTIDTDLYQAKLSSRGGGTLTSWRLKEHLKDGEWVEIIPDTAFGNLAVSTDHGLDFSQYVFSLDRDEIDGEGNRILAFSKTIDTGQLHRIFTIYPNRYDLGLEIKWIGFSWEQVGEKYYLEWQSGMNPTESGIKDDMQYVKAYALQGNELTDTKDKDTGLMEGSTEWVAVRTKYFMMTLMPHETAGVAARLYGNKSNDWTALEAELAMKFRPQDSASDQFRIFIGPMDYEILKSYDKGLEKTMSFGWILFKPFSIAAHYALGFLYGILGNYGWAIIVFGVFIKIILYPLTKSSYKSMREMQALQPRLKALQEKHKGNPQKLNEETMKLYKSHGVNPMGGCLPMLLQMPILIGLFNLFRSTIMLRQADFYLIQDLSAPDAMFSVGGTAIHVLPLLMGVTMFFQQKLSSMQSSQQKAMMFMMPVFMTFIFYKFASGLNLYYLVFNVVTIAQEIIVKRGKRAEDIT